MNLSDDLTPHTAVSRLVSEYAAQMLVMRIAAVSEDHAQLRQTVVCIAALLEHPSYSTLFHDLEAVNIEAHMPHDLDGYIRTLIDVCFQSAKVS